jgi:hypothetical protein
MRRGSLSWLYTSWLIIIPLAIFDGFSRRESKIKTDLYIVLLFKADGIELLIYCHPLSWIIAGAA